MAQRDRRRKTRKRRRIVALLRAHPQGLTADEIRVDLKFQKPLGPLLQRMVQQGFLRGNNNGNRKGGRYLGQ